MDQLFHYGLKGQVGGKQARPVEEVGWHRTGQDRTETVEKKRWMDGGKKREA